MDIHKCLEVFMAIVDRKAEIFGLKSPAPRPAACTISGGPVLLLMTTMAMKVLQSYLRIRNIGGTVLEDFDHRILVPS